MPGPAGTNERPGLSHLVLVPTHRIMTQLTELMFLVLFCQVCQAFFSARFHGGFELHRKSAVYSSYVSVNNLTNTFLVGSDPEHWT